MAPSRSLRALKWLWYNFPVLFGYIYTAQLLVLGGLILAGHASPSVHTAFKAGLWGYAYLAALNFYVMMVFIYNTCCIDGQSFWRHLSPRHLPPLAYVLEPAMSVIWPLNWHLVIRSQAEEADWFSISVVTSICLLGSFRAPEPAHPLTKTAFLKEGPDSPL